MGEAAGGTGGRGDPVWTMGTGQTMGGRGVERSDSGVAERLKREKWALWRAEKRQPQKKAERWKVGAHPKVLGAPPVYSRTVR